MERSLISKVLVLLGFLGALFVCGAERASATACSVPNSFSNGAVINAAPFNANFTALVTCTQNIDNTNIGAAGIYASQVIPLTVGEATFAGSLYYTFPLGFVIGTANSATTQGIRLGNGVSGLTVIDTSPVSVSGVSSALLRIGNSGGGTLAALDNSGNLGIAGNLSGASITLGGTTLVKYSVTLVTSGSCTASTTCGLVNSTPSGTPVSGPYSACTANASTANVSPIEPLIYTQQVAAEPGPYFYVYNTTGSTIGTSTSIGVSGVCM